MFRLHINKYVLPFSSRYIKDTNILLDGITLLTGPNNSGKEAIRELMYAAIHYHTERVIQDCLMGLDDYKNRLAGIEAFRKGECGDNQFSRFGTNKVDFSLWSTDKNGKEVLVKNNDIDNMDAPFDVWTIGTGRAYDILDRTDSDCTNLKNDHRRIITKDIARIIGGEVYAKRSGNSGYYNWQFVYDNDTLVSLYESCPIFIRAFGSLQGLVKYKIAYEQTVLFIEEPERGLHPSLVVEYAKLMVAMNKFFGVRFLVTSLSPDFVRALKRISEQSGILDKVHFYFPEADEENSIKFLDAHENLAPILDSFNIDVDKICAYNGMNDVNKG